MVFTVCDLIILLDLYFPIELPASEALYFLLLLLTLSPIYLLHLNQRRDPHQPQETAWKKSIRTILETYGETLKEGVEYPKHAVAPETYVPQLYSGIDELFNYMGLFDGLGSPQNAGFSFPSLPPILTSPYQHCIICNNSPQYSLHRFTPPRQITVLGADNVLWNTFLVVAECPNRQCRAAYYPDRITYKTANGRHQRILCDAKYLGISKTGRWVHRKVAEMQEHCIHRLHCGWSNLTEFYNDSYGPKYITVRQSQRMFSEHFVRRLLVAHGLEVGFSVVTDLS